MKSDWPKDWDVIPLSEAGEWLSGGTPRTQNEDYWDGDIPWISAKTLTTFYLRESDRCVTQLGAENGTRVVPEGSTLFLVRGMSLKTEFRVGIATRELAFSQDCKAIIPRDDIHPLFLANALRGREREVLAKVDTAGHGTGRLATELIEALPIGLPRFDEQRAIAEVLGSLDERITWCGELAESMRDASSLVVARLEKADRIPLGSVAEIRRETISDVDLDGANWTYYSIPAFDESRRPVVEDGSDIKSGKYRVPGCSVLVSKLNPSFPRTWLPNESDSPEPICSTEFMPLVPTTEIGIAVLWALVSSERFNKQLQQHASGSTGSHQRVRPDDMLSCEVGDPKGLSQAESNLLKDYASMVLSLRTEKTSLERCLEYLLPRLVSGELRIHDVSRVLDPLPK